MKQIVIGVNPEYDAMRETVAQLERAFDEQNRLSARVEDLERLLLRYRTETPLGHQPHMIAHEVDAILNR